MIKVKNALQRITSGVLALVFTVLLAVPKAKAVTGVDDVSVGIMAVLVHLESIGGSLAVQQGTALATQNAVTALATQAGAAGALGAGVTGTAALATIGAAVTAFAGGYTIGHIGYEALSKLVEWIRQARLTGAAPNKVYISGGTSGWGVLADGSANIAGPSRSYSYGDVYMSKTGTTWWVDADANTITLTMVGSDGSFYTYPKTLSSINDISVGDKYGISYWSGTSVDVMFLPSGSSEHSTTFYPGYDGQFKGLTVAPDNATNVREEVTYMPPVTWTPPVPAPGQDVYYNPYPSAPEKSIEDIVQDVPKDIYDKKFDPAPPQVIDPAVPPVNPDLPPVVNPNPPVDPPAEVQPYTVQLGDVFPFCIPFDLYHMVTLFVAEPEAPHAKWEFSLPFAAGTYKVEWDLQEWDEVAALCRKLELILFCVGLAVVTSKLIKW